MQPFASRIGDTIHIQFIITGLSTGGAETMLLKLLERIDRTKFSPGVISLTNVGEIGPRIAALGIPVEALGMSRGVLSPIRFLRLVRHLRQIKPDVVHTWMYHADLIGGFAAWIARVPVVIWGVFSSDFLRIDRRFSIRFISTLCKRLSSWLPDCVQYCSENGKEVHGRYGYREQSSVIVPIGIDTEKFKPLSHARHEIRQELGIMANTPLIGFVGRFDPVKNPEGFVKAAGFLHHNMPGIHFLMIGTGIEWSNPVLRNLIEGAKLTGVFHLLGRRDDVPCIAASLDLASLTSWSEGFPSVLVEAMACGVPCVSTDVGDAAVILGDAGWTVPTGDMEGLAAQWAVFMALSEGQRKLLGERSRARVMDQFELGMVVKCYEAMYFDVVKRKCHNSAKQDIEEQQ